jgi:hypothetical protein
MSSEAGKGSGRRNENTKKVIENLAKVKHDKKPDSERPFKINYK